MSVHWKKDAHLLTFHVLMQQLFLHNMFSYLYSCYDCESNVYFHVFSQKNIKILPLGISSDYSYAEQAAYESRQNGHDKKRGIW